MKDLINKPKPIAPQVQVIPQSVKPVVALAPVLQEPQLMTSLNNDTSGKQITVVPLEQFQALFRELLRDELKLTLHPRQSHDMFEEELRVLVQSLQVGTAATAQKIIVRVLSSEHEELSATELPGERLVLVTGNENFFCFYTNRQQLHVFSSASLELIQRGIVIEGVCMMA